MQRKGQSHPDLQISFVDAAVTARFTADENIADAAIAARKAKTAGWFPLY
jgi:hypothetical protein